MINGSSRAVLALQSALPLPLITGLVGQKTVRHCGGDDVPNIASANAADRVDRTCTAPASASRRHDRSPRYVVARTWADVTMSASSSVRAHDTSSPETSSA